MIPLVKYDHARVVGENIPINISNVDKEYRRLHQFSCPYCNNVMNAVLGNGGKTPHFRHKGKPCQFNNYLHALAEDCFIYEYRKCIDSGAPFYLSAPVPINCNNACVLKDHVNCGAHYVKCTMDLTKVYTIVSKETRVSISGTANKYRRPDILLRSEDGRQLWIEIWVKHETDSDKKLDGPIVEIRIESEADVELFCKHSLEQTPGERKVNIYNSERIAFDITKDNVIVPCDRFLHCDVDSWGGYQFTFRETVERDDTPERFRIVLGLNWNGNHTSFGNIHSPLEYSVVESECRHWIQYRIQHGIPPTSSPISSIIRAVLPGRSQTIHEFHQTPSTEIRTLPVYPSRRPAHIIPRDGGAIDRGTLVPFLGTTIKREWVDLNLPSGTLWAKGDETQSNYGNARSRYPSLIPTDEQVMELARHCIMTYDERNKLLVFSAESGNSISFRIDKGVVSMWLACYLKDREFAQCARLYSDGRIMVNDEEPFRQLSVHLVKPKEEEFPSVTRFFGLDGEY